jgi:colanic acid/amylovoran biosynthesis glycosyltransferase
MRIAFVVQEFPALSETFILNQISGLIDLGHEVDIYAVEPRRQDSKVHPDVEKYGLRSRTYYAVKIPDNRWQQRLKLISLVAANFHKAPMAIGRLLNLSKSGVSRLTLLCEFIPWLHRSRSYDIIHCHFGMNGVKAALFKEIGAIQGRLITVFHGFDMTLYLQQVGDRVYDRLLATADLLMPISKLWQQKLIELGGDEKKIVVHHMGIDCRRFIFQVRKPSDRTVRILTIARLVEKKGVEYGIRAIAKLGQKFPNLEYQIVGDGPLKQNLQELIQELQIGNNVKLLGWKQQQEIAEILAQTHIFMAPSVTSQDGDGEGIPVVLMEAMACGMPIVSTMHSGIPELVEHGVSGFLVAERDVDALAEKLSYLIQNPETWEKIGAAGRAYVEKYYNISRLNEQLVDTYRQLLN